MKDNPVTAADFLENIAEVTTSISIGAQSAKNDVKALHTLGVGIEWIEDQIRKYRRIHSPQDGAELAVSEANGIAESIKRQWQTDECLNGRR